MKTLKLKAVFKGKNNSCGYKTNNEYDLIIQHKEGDNVHIKNINGGGACVYSSMVSFFENWNNICRTQEIKDENHAQDAVESNSSEGVLYNFFYKDAFGKMSHKTIEINKNDSEFAIAKFEKENPDIVWRSFLNP